MRTATTPVTTLANKSTTVGMIPVRSRASTAGDVCNVCDDFGHIPIPMWNVCYVK